MPLTDNEVIDKFNHNYALILDDYLHDLKNKCNDEGINILDKPKSSIGQDFLDLILFNADLIKTFPSRKKTKML
jgi:hypothetical protein